MLHEIHDTWIFRRLQQLSRPDGVELTLALAGVSIRCLQLWIRRFNQSGIDGITYRPKSGRPRLMKSAEISEKILPVVDDPKLADRHHWTARALCGWLKNNKELMLNYRTLVRYLHEQHYARRIPRPMPEPPDKDKWLQAREAFLPELAKLHDDEQVELFIGDESGFEGDPRPRQRWVKRGSRPSQGYYGEHARENVVGAVNPITGQLVSPADFMPVQSIARTLPGVWPWVKNTSLLGPFYSRQSRTRRWNVRKCFSSGVAPAPPGIRCL